MTHNITLIWQLFIVFAVYVSLVNPLQAAIMPDYERLQPIITSLYAPTAVALDVDGNIYVLESSKNRLLMYNPAGERVKTLSGLHKPVSVAVGREGRFFVGNSDTGNVEVYNSDLALLFKLGIGNSEFTQPTAIAVDDAGKVYVADSQEDTIKVYHSDGSPHFSFGSFGDADGQFYFPTAIAIDEILEELIIVDLQIVRSMFSSHEGARIQVFDMNGGFKRSFGEHGFGEGKLAKPLGVEVDDAGRIYVSDAYQSVVQVFSSDGTFLGTIDDPENPMETPLGIALDAGNRLFIASLTASRVDLYRIMAPDFSTGPGSYPDPIPGIPEPAMVLLFGSGLVGIFALRRRKLK